MNRDTKLFIELIKHKETKITHLSFPYAIAILLKLVDFEGVNQAILDRWSNNALVTIQNNAWGIIGYLEQIDYRDSYSLGKIWLYMDHIWGRDLNLKGERTQWNNHPNLS